MREGLLETLMLRRDIEIAEWRGKTEILHPDRLDVALRPDLERLFGDRLEPHIFEDRQHVGERAGAAGAIEPEAQRAVLAAFRPVQQQRERRAAAHLLDAIDIAERRRDRVALAIIARKSAAVARRQRQARASPRAWISASLSLSAQLRAA